MRHLALIAAILPIGTAQAQTCYDKAVLEGYLKHEYAMSLHSWGLDDAGDMLELWLAENGHWAVVTTTPRQCSTVDLPSALHGRLWVPPVQNKAIPPTREMTQGDDA